MAYVIHCRQKPADAKEHLTTARVSALGEPSEPPTKRIHMDDSDKPRAERSATRETRLREPIKERAAQLTVFANRRPR